MGTPINENVVERAFPKSALHVLQPQISVMPRVPAFQVRTRTKPPRLQMARCIRCAITPPPGLCSISLIEITVERGRSSWSGGEACGWGSLEVPHHGRD